jgi:hypothetical protein
LGKNFRELAEIWRAQTAHPNFWAKQIAKNLGENWIVLRPATLTEDLENTVAEPQRLEQRFLEHADKWERETEHLSSPTQMMMHPSYQAILGMGRDIVPLLLRDLQENRRPWFWALSYITKDNPINPPDAGKMDRMIKAWVDWGRARGLL